jgi:hypothetical protein
METPPALDFGGRQSGTAGPFLPHRDSAPASSDPPAQATLQGELVQVRLVGDGPDQAHRFQLRVSWAISIH